MINIQKPNKTKPVNVSAPTGGIKGIRIEGRDTRSQSSSRSSSRSGRSRKSETTMLVPEPPAVYASYSNESGHEPAAPKSAFERMLANPDKQIKEPVYEEDSVKETPTAGGGIFSGWFSGNEKNKNGYNDDDNDDRSERSGSDSSSNSGGNYQSRRRSRGRDPKTEHIRNEVLSDLGKSGYGGGGYASSEAGSEPVEYLTEKQILERKAHYLSLFDRLRKKGVNVYRNFTMADDYTDIKNEYIRIKKMLDSDNSIQFSRKMLMLCVSGLEFLNGRYDPFKLKLNGWSETVLEDIDSYDDVFDELYEKYADVGDMAPEIKLLLMIGGSAFMYNLTQNMSSQQQVPGNGVGAGGFGGGDLIGSINPATMQNLMNLARTGGNGRMPSQQQMGSIPMMPMMPQGPPPPIATQAPPQHYPQQVYGQTNQDPRPAPPPIQVPVPVDGFGREFMPNRPQQQIAPGMAPRPVPTSKLTMRGPSEDLNQTIKRMQREQQQANDNGNGNGNGSGSESGSDSGSGSGSGSESGSSDNSKVQTVTVNPKRGRGGNARGNRGRGGRGRGGVTVNI